MSRPSSNAEKPSQPSRPASSPEKGEAAEAEPKGMPTSDRYKAETVHAVEPETQPGQPYAGHK